MKISTETGSISDILGHQCALEYIARAGFDAYDFSMFEMAKFLWKSHTIMDTKSPLRESGYLDYIRDIKKLGESLNIHCNQTHAPFPTYVPEVRAYLERAIECTAELGAEICVVHPFNNMGIPENTAFYNEILPYAKSLGVKIATENMFSWGGNPPKAGPAACSDHTAFLDLVEAVDDPYLVACLDIGHAEMAGLNTSAVEMIHTLGKHIKALHIHDNDKVSDLHAIPFTKNIDFAPVVKALKDINYSGYFTLEPSYALDGCEKENVFEMVCQMADSAKKLVNMYENC